MHANLNFSVWIMLVQLEEISRPGMIMWSLALSMLRRSNSELDGQTCFLLVIAAAKTCQLSDKNLNKSETTSPR